jgi:hypothetical protein
MNYTRHIKPYYLINTINNEVIRLFGQSDNIVLLRLFCNVNKVKMRFLELTINH